MMIERSALLLKLFDVHEKIRADQEAHMKNSEETPPCTHKKSHLHHSMRQLLMHINQGTKLNQRALATKMHISSQAVSELVKKLSQEGLVEKISGAQNNENYIVLTEKGAVITERMEEKVKNHADSLFAVLTEEEVASMYGILDKIFLGEEKA